MVYKRPHILLVDDDTDNCEMLPVLLQLDGDRYDFTTCNTFGDARDQIEEGVFDLYILDYVMPEIDGAEACRYIRQNDRSTPILIYSGLGHKQARDSTYAAGADLFLVKPADLDIIGPSIKGLLKQDSVVSNAA